MRDERRTHVSLKNHSRNIPFRILILINCGIYCITNNIPCGAACAEVINLICSILPSIIVPAKEHALSKQSYNNRLCSAFMKGSRLFKHDSVHKVRPVKKYAVMCENLNRTVKTYDLKPLNTMTASLVLSPEISASLISLMVLQLGLKFSQVTKSCGKPSQRTLMMNGHDSEMFNAFKLA